VPGRSYLGISAKGKVYANTPKTIASIRHW
jgi:hypothetical protein